MTDAATVTASPWTYRDYIARSRGEFSVAVNLEVKSRSGWFSDRTAAYLASGRPAVVQDTGFSEDLPTGEGLFAFRTVDDAAAAIEAIARRLRAAFPGGASHRRGAPGRAPDREPGARRRCPGRRLTPATSQNVTDVTERNGV